LVRGLTHIRKLFMMSRCDLFEVKDGCSWVGSANTIEEVKTQVRHRVAEAAREWAILDQSFPYANTVPLRCCQRGERTLSCCRLRIFSLEGSSWHDGCYLGSSALAGNHWCSFSQRDEPFNTKISSVVFSAPEYSQAFAVSASTRFRE